MTTGTEWLIDAAGCDRALLGDLGAIRAVCDQIVTDLGLCVVGEPLWHPFPFPGGVTGMYLLTESHLACHTFPEFGLATFNLYCCRPRTAWPWESKLTALLCARQVTARSVPRVGSTPAAPPSTRRHTARAEEGP